jgi:hypothetical protein
VAGADRQALVDALLARHGQTFAEELGLKVERDTPAVLFQLLAAALMSSARTSAGAAVKAFSVLCKAGLTTPRKMAAAGWDKRTRLLNEHGYARYGEKTSSMLGDAGERVAQEYWGDLRRLRQAAEHDLRQERNRLQALKSIVRSVPISSAEKRNWSGMSYIRSSMIPPWPGFAGWSCWPIRHGWPNWLTTRSFPAWWMHWCGWSWPGITRR